MLQKNQTVFILIDVQGKLARIVHESEVLVKNLKTLIKGLQLLEIPMLWVEQYPEGLGETIPELSEDLTHLTPIKKKTFSACQNNEFIKTLKALNRSQVLVAGIEAHICVYQTSTDIKKLGYEIQVVTDAVSSRTLANKAIGLERMRDAGITWTSVETALFELMQVAEGDTFKQLVTLLK